MNGPTNSATASAGKSAKNSPAADSGSDAAQVIPLFETILRELRELHDVVRERRKDFYSVAEFAELVGRAPYTIRTWIAEKRLDATRLPKTGARGRLLISHSEVQRITHRGGSSEDFPAGDFPIGDGGLGQFPQSMAAAPTAEKR